NGLFAALANAVVAAAHLFEGVFNIRQLATFDFGELGADFVLGGIERSVDHVAGGLSAQLFEQTQIAGERLTERVTSLDQDLPEGKDCVFACHGSLPSWSDPPCAWRPPCLTNGDNRTVLWVASFLSSEVSGLLCVGGAGRLPGRKATKL